MSFENRCPDSGRPRTSDPAQSKAPVASQASLLPHKTIRSTGKGAIARLSKPALHAVSPHSLCASAPVRDHTLLGEELIMINVFHTRGARPDQARARASDDFTSGAFRRRTGIMLFLKNHFLRVVVATVCASIVSPSDICDRTSAIASRTRARDATATSHTQPRLWNHFERF